MCDIYITVNLHQEGIYMKHSKLITLSLITLLLAGCSSNASSSSSSSMKQYAQVNSYADLPFDLMNQKSEQIEMGRFMGSSVRLTPDLCTIDLVDEEHQVYSQEVRETESLYCDSSSSSRNTFGVKSATVNGLANAFWDELGLTNIRRNENIDNYMRLKVENYFNKMFSHTIKAIDNNERKAFYVLMERSASWTHISRGQGTWNAKINENFEKACEDAIKENTYSAYCNIFETYGIGVVNRVTYWPANTSFLGFSSKDYYANLTVSSYNKDDIIYFMNKLIKEEGSLNMCDFTVNAAEEDSWRLLDFEFLPIYRALNSLSMSDEAGFKQAYDQYILEKTNELKRKVQSPTSSMSSYLRDSLKVLSAQEDSTISLEKNKKYTIDVTPSEVDDYDPSEMLELGYTKLFVRPKIRQKMNTVGFKMNDEITIGDKCVKMMDDSLYTNYSGTLCTKWFEFDINDLLSNKSKIHYEYSVDAALDVTAVELELCYAK